MKVISNMEKQLEMLTRKDCLNNTVSYYFILVNEKTISLLEVANRQN